MKEDQAQGAQLGSGNRGSKRQSDGGNVLSRQRRQVVKETAESYLIMPKTIPFNEIEKWLEKYPRWKQRIETIKSQLSHIPGLTARLEQVAIHGQGQKNESVLNEVIKRLQLREEELPFWMIRVEVMEGAIKTLLPEDQHFVELKYMQHLSNDDLMDRFHLSASMLYRKRQDVLQQIYEEVGGETSVLWVPWKKNDA